MGSGESNGPFRPYTFARRDIFELSSVVWAEYFSDSSCSIRRLIASMAERNDAPNSERSPVEKTAGGNSDNIREPRCPAKCMLPISVDCAREPWRCCFPQAVSPPWDWPFQRQPGNCMRRPSPHNRRLMALLKSTMLCLNPCSVNS